MSQCNNIFIVVQAWNDVTKVTRLENLFISVNKKFKKAGSRLIFLV